MLFCYFSIKSIVIVDIVVKWQWTSLRWKAPTWDSRSSCRLVSWGFSDVVKVFTLEIPSVWVVVPLLLCCGALCRGNFVVLFLIFCCKVFAQALGTRCLIHMVLLNAMCTYEIKIFQNYFGFCRIPSEMIPNDKLRFLAYQISWLSDWVTEYPIFLRQLAQQWGGEQKRNLAQS